MATPPPRVQRVLVIDDDAAMRGLVRDALLPRGCRSEEAPHSTAAWPLLERASFDLIVLDLGLVEGWGGLEVLRRLKAWERTRAVPVVVFSAVSDPEISAKALALGAARLIGKPPADFAAIRRELAELLARPRPAAPTGAGGGPMVLLLEDDDEYRGWLTTALAAEGFRCLACAGAAEAWRALERSEPDFILLDRNLPGADGLDFCRRARGSPRWAEAPIAFLSADRVLSEGDDWLAAGADSCWLKPTGAKRLGALLKGLLRRRGAGGGPTELVPGVRLERGARRVVAGAYCSRRLSEREVRFLAFLGAAGGAPVARQAVLDAFFPGEREGAELLLNQLLRRLRAKLPGPLGSLIETRWGEGFRLVAPPGGGGANCDRPVIDRPAVRPHISGSPGGLKAPWRPKTGGTAVRRGGARPRGWRSSWGPAHPCRPWPPTWGRAPSPR